MQIEFQLTTRFTLPIGLVLYPGTRLRLIKVTPEGAHVTPITQRVRRQVPNPLLSIVDELGFLIPLSQLSCYGPH